MSEFLQVLHTEGPQVFEGDENYFYDLEADIGWVLSWDVPDNPDG